MCYTPRWLVTTVLATELMLVAETRGVELVATNKTTSGVALSSDITQIGRAHV